MADVPDREYDLLFPVVPASDDPLGPDERGGADALVDDLGDFAWEEQQAEADEYGDEFDGLGDESTGTDFAFNWDEQEFFTDEAGDPLRVNDDAAIMEWALKALNTPKGEYPIYSEDYGSNLPKLLGQPIGSPMLNAEIARTIEECLAQHPRITTVQVDSIRAEREVDPDGLFVAFSFWIDDDDEPIEMEIAA